MAKLILDAVLISRLIFALLIPWHCLPTFPTAFMAVAYPTSGPGLGRDIVVNEGFYDPDPYFRDSLTLSKADIQPIHSPRGKRNSHIPDDAHKKGFLLRPHSMVVTANSGCTSGDTRNHKYEGTLTQTGSQNDRLTIPSSNLNNGEATWSSFRPFEQLVRLSTSQGNSFSLKLTHDYQKSEKDCTLWVFCDSEYKDRVETFPSVDMKLTSLPPPSSTGMVLKPMTLRTKGSNGCTIDVVVTFRASCSSPFTYSEDLFGNNDPGCWYDENIYRAVETNSGAIIDLGKQDLEIKDDLLKKIVQVSKEVEDAEASLSTQFVSSLKEEKANREKADDGLEKSINSLITQDESFLNRVKALGDRDTELEEALHSSKEDLTKSINNLNAKDGELEKALESSKQQLTKSIDALKATDGEFEGKIGALESSKKELAKSIDGLNAKDGELENALESSKKELTKSIDSLNAKDGELENALESSKQQLTKSIDSLNAKDGELENALESSKQELTKSIDSLNAKDGELENALESSKKELTKSIDSLNAKDGELENALESSKQQLTKSIDNLNAKDGELENAL
eukprot:Nk52_evm4s484 gene=Nk52_evmTU4s484